MGGTTMLYELEAGDTERYEVTILLDIGGDVYVVQVMSVGACEADGSGRVYAECLIVGDDPAMTFGRVLPACTICELS